MLARAERLHREFFRPVRGANRLPAWEPPVDMLETSEAVSGTTGGIQRIARTPRIFAPTDEEQDAHRRFIAGLTDPIWNK